MKLEPIDTSTTAGKAEVETLYRQGRQLVMHPHGFPLWGKAENPQFNWDSMNYAIIRADLAGRDE